MMTNMKTVFYLVQSRAAPNDPDGLTKRNGLTIGIRRQQSSSVVRVWYGMIGNEVTDLFRLPEKLKLSTDKYCSFLKKLIEP